MKIGSISDMHGNLPVVTEQYDVITINGDIYPDYDDIGWYVKLAYQIGWHYSTFIPWLNNLNCNKILIIAGNHDHCIAHLGKTEYQNAILCPDKEIIYLQDSSTIINGIKFYGLPWVADPLIGKVFSFTGNSQLMSAACDNIDQDTNVLLSHGPPKGILDLWHLKLIHLGSQELLNKINTMKDLKYLLCGHIHGQNPFIKNHNNFTVINTAERFTSFELK